jgi:hypothetical protein
MKLHGSFIAIVSIIVIFGFHFQVFADMSSTNYQIQWDSMSAGGDEESVSGSYKLRDTIGEISAKDSSSTSFLVNYGYRSGIYDRTADFYVYLMDRASQVATTAIAGQIVSVTSVSGFTSGNMIVVIQNEGGSQVEAIGKITSIDPVLNTLTIDSWDVGASGIPTIDGVNDYVYELDSSSVSLGTLSSSTISTSIIAMEVSAEIDDGYSVYLYEDHEMTNGTDTIPDVSDGSVSASSSEYGARSSDQTLTLSTFDSQDTGITSDFQQVASGSSAVFERRNYLTLKSSISGSETDGTYSQTLTLLYVGDY